MCRSCFGADEYFYQIPALCLTSNFVQVPTLTCVKTPCGGGGLIGEKKKDMTQLENENAFHHLSPLHQMPEPSEVAETAT